MARIETILKGGNGNITNTPDKPDAGRALLHMGLGTLQAAGRPGSTALGALGAGGMAALSKVEGDKKTAAASRQKAFENRLNTGKLYADVMQSQATREATTEDRRARRAETARHNKETEGLQGETRDIRRANLERQTGADQTRVDAEFAKQMRHIDDQVAVSAYARVPFDRESALRSLVETFPNAQGTAAVRVELQFMEFQRKLAEVAEKNDWSEEQVQEKLREAEARKNKALRGAQDEADHDRHLTAPGRRSVTKTAASQRQHRGRQAPSQTWRHRRTRREVTR